MPDQYSGAPTLAEVIGMAVNSGDQASKNTTALSHLILGNQLGQQTQEKNLQTAQDITDKYSGKGKKVSVNLSGNGGVSLGENEPSLTSQLLGNQKAQAAAVKGAVDIYQHGLPDIQKRLDAAKEGLDAVNDPKQVGSIGQAKSLMIKNLGMNRYNEQEGNALVPKTLSQKISEIFNYSGDDNSPLNPAQRAALNQVFMNSLDMAKNKHDMLKKNAMNAYQVSPFFDPTRADQLNQTIGGPLEQSISDIQKQYKSAPTTNYQPGVTQAPPNQNIFSKLLSHIGLSSNQPAQVQPQQPAPQQAQAPVQQSMPQPGAAPQPGAIVKVREKSTGRKGQMPMSEVNDQFEVIQ